MPARGKAHGRSTSFAHSCNRTPPCLTHLYRVSTGYRRPCPTLAFCDRDPVHKVQLRDSQGLATSFNVVPSHEPGQPEPRPHETPYDTAWATIESLSPPVQQIRRMAARRGSRSATQLRTIDVAVIWTARLMSRPQGRRGAGARPVSHANIRDRSRHADAWDPVLRREVQDRLEPLPAALPQRVYHPTPQASITLHADWLSPPLLPILERCDRIPRHRTGATRS